MADAMDDDPVLEQELPDFDDGNPAPNAADRIELEMVLRWIGYDSDLQISALADELGSLQEFSSYSYKDISAMVKDGVSYGQNRKLKFPLSRQKSLKQMIDWAKDRKKLDEPVSLFSAGIDTQAKFLRAIKLAYDRKEIRDKEKDAHEAQLKTASPGKLKDEKIWEDWLTGLHTTLTLMRGVTDVPLSYVIRRDVTPKEGEVYESFDEECIAKAPLTGPAFDADARSVHLVIKPLVVGENAEQWIQSGFKKKNGRDDLFKLMAHYQGEGNSSRRIHVAEQMWNTLHYRNERALAFATFISKAQKMMNIYFRNDEAKPMAAQVRWLLDRVQDPTLTATVASLNVDVEKDPQHLIWDFNKCANHIANQIRKKTSTENVKNISGVNAKTGSGRNGIYKDGEVYTGTYTGAEWQALSSEDRSTIIKARGSKKGAGGNGPAQKNTKKVKALTKKVKRQQKQIASLKKRAPADDSDEDSEKEEPMNDAGNSFGGRAGKQNSKKKQKTE